MGPSSPNVMKMVKLMILIWKTAFLRLVMQHICFRWDLPCLDGKLCSEREGEPLTSHGCDPYVASDPPITRREWAIVFRPWGVPHLTPAAQDHFPINFKHSITGAQCKHIIIQCREIKSVFTHRLDRRWHLTSSRRREKEAAQRWASPTGQAQFLKRTWGRMQAFAKRIQL